jgi:uncharacterized membrane protein YhiD involved in acid resistance
MSLTGLITKGSMWASGINWTAELSKLAIKASILIITAVVFYREGVNNTEVKQANDKVTEITKTTIEERTFVRDELKKRDKEISDRLAYLSAPSQEARQLRADVLMLTGKVNEAINSKPGNAVCAPDDDLMLYYEGLAAQSHK